MKRLFLAAAAVAALAACSDTYAERNRIVGTSAAPATTAQDPISNSGQTPSMTSGSVSNTASGSRGTPAR